jgi:hypothetical protein
VTLCSEVDGLALASIQRPEQLCRVGDPSGKGLVRRRFDMEPGRRIFDPSADGGRSFNSVELILDGWGE